MRQRNRRCHSGGRDGSDADSADGGGAYGGAVDNGDDGDPSGDDDSCGRGLCSDVKNCGDADRCRNTRAFCGYHGGHGGGDRVCRRPRMRLL